MDLVVIDCQNDFIDGTMACEFANEAVDNIIEYFKDDMNVYYIRLSSNKSHEL